MVLYRTVILTLTGYCYCRRLELKKRDSVFIMTIINESLVLFVAGTDLFLKETCALKKVANLDVIKNNIRYIH